MSCTSSSVEDNDTVLPNGTTPLSILCKNHISKVWCLIKIHKLFSGAQKCHFLKSKYTSKYRNILPPQVSKGAESESDVNFFVRRTSRLETRYLDVDNKNLISFALARFDAVALGIKLQNLLTRFSWNPNLMFVLTYYVCFATGRN